MSVGYLIELERSARPRRAAAMADELAGISWPRAVLLRIHASRLLSRALRRPQPLRLDEMPAYLKRDLGLPPDLM